MYDSATPEEKLQRKRTRRAFARIRKDLLALFKELYTGCFYCESGKVETIDHCEPIFKGGDNNLSNLVPCCDACNQKKGGRSLIPSEKIALTDLNDRRKNLLGSYQGQGNLMWRVLELTRKGV